MGAGNSSAPARRRRHPPVGGGIIEITAGDDALTAATDVVVLGGTINAVAGGGHDTTAADSTAPKGITADAGVVIGGGELTLVSGDDAMKADVTLDATRGTLDVTTSYEGLDSAALTVSGGDISIISTDDGLNTSAPETGGSGTYPLTIGGGTVVIDAGGDGIDINGPITMTAGTLLINGPTQQGNGPIGYDGTFDISGGIVVATGSSGMAMAPSVSSSQHSLLATFATQDAGTLVRVQAADGTEIVTFRPTKAFQSIAVSTSAIGDDTSYEVLVGGTSYGTETDGVVTGGSYSGGEVVTTTTSDEAVSQGPGGGGP